MTYPLVRLTGIYIITSLVTEELSPSMPGPYAVIVSAPMTCSSLSVFHAVVPAMLVHITLHTHG